MIRLTDLTKRFSLPPTPRRGPRTVTALEAVTLELEPGGVCGVVGPNGAGKTTLFGVLLGFLFPTAGDVRIRELEPRAYTRRHGVGYLPERFDPPGEWTVRSALAALARLDGLGRGAGPRADALIERLGLEAHAGKRLADLSRGLLQRVGIAQALLAPRELVVLDEPAEGLDPLWRIRLRELVRELRADGRLVLLASHDLAEVERLADRVLLLDAGRVVEMIELSPAAGPRRFRIELAAPSAASAIAFPDADAPDEAAFEVTVADAGELSGRLAALLEAGAVLVSVRPQEEALEARVRRTLGREEDE